jgi:hypothetical protein
MIKSKMRTATVRKATGAALKVLGAYTIRQFNPVLGLVPIIIKHERTSERKSSTYSWSSQANFDGMKFPGTVTTLNEVIQEVCL